MATIAVCPDCGADTGQRCVDLVTGEVLEVAHRSRRRLELAPVPLERAREWMARCRAELEAVPVRPDWTGP